MDQNKTGRKVADIKSERVQTLINALKSGAYIQTACTYSGVGESTVYRWLERGRKENDRLENDEKPNPDETPYLELWESIEKARAEATLRNLQVIQTSAQNGNWQASAWFLERTMPAQYGRRAYNEVTGPNGGALQVAMTVDELNDKIGVLMGEVIDESGQASITS
jgi:transposase